MKLKVLDLFSGIGGFSLGLERTGGFETVAFCEIDPFCQKVLKKNFEDLFFPNFEIPTFSDVRLLNLEGEKIDVVTGGYPCQPFSTAGKRGGDRDDRHLWPEMFRIIRSHRPSWVIGENVNGHISLGLDEVLSDLESIDYEARTFVLPAVAVDARQGRERVWIVSHAKESRKRREIGNLRQENGGSGASLFQQSNSAMSGFRGSFRWPTEPALSRVANGIPQQLDRTSALGNAVVPQIPEIIGHAILQAARQEAPTDKGEVK